MKVSKESMLRHFSEELQAGTSALFVGAGISVPAGYVSWKTLMHEIANDLGLDVNRETDLIAIAQFDVNRRGGRARINRTLIEEFTKKTKLTENHHLISSLPNRVIWTTNYDTLIEDAFRAANRRPDVKIVPENLSHSLPHSDAVIYKMHGDISQPHQAVITKDDYETYDDKRTLFSTALKGDLVERTFLFLGFSFNDPNIDYILSRIRALLGTNQRDHYCVMKWPDKPSSNDANGLAEYEYQKRKLELRIEDLNRYHIQAVMIDSYEEVTEILRELNKRSHYSDVFVSGSADVYSPFSRERLESLARRLGAELIARQLSLVSGFGRGLGGAVVLGALERAYLDRQSIDSVKLFPFPQDIRDEQQKTRLYRHYRENILAKVGFVIFIAGNKSQGVTEASNAAGVLEEFEIAAKMGKVPIALGASGWAARQIWRIVVENTDRYFGKVNVTSELDILGDESKSDDEYIEAIFSIIKAVSRSSA
jgi:hypothetical protein